MLGAGFATILATQVMAAGPHVAPLEEFAKTTVAEWIANPAIIAAIKAQNAKNAALSEDQIIELDKKWRAETKASSHPMIDGLLNSDISKTLADYRDSTTGMVTEIFIMDNKGLNVAQSDITSDFWQGDEGKWQKTYLVGPDTVFVDEIETDESTQTLQSQMSMSIKDPATGEAIGAITVGVNVEAL
ncbi:MAG: hypothetical protein COC24_013470 [Alphaproteobacteria bacterium]|nr:hypothetical protein [Alphaproteobacteria bacterium]